MVTEATHQGGILAVEIHHRRIDAFEHLAHTVAFVLKPYGVFHFAELLIQHGVHGHRDVLIEGEDEAGLPSGGNRPLGFGLQRECA